MLTPLAVAELNRLFADVLSGDPDAVRAWCVRNAARARKRERHVLQGLTAGIVLREYERTALQPGQFYAFRSDDTEEEWQLMCNRLGVAMLNGEFDTIEALIQAWAMWPAEERQKVLAGFAWRLWDQWGNART